MRLLSKCDRRKNKHFLYTLRHNKFKLLLILALIISSILLHCIFDCYIDSTLSGIITGIIASLVLIVWDEYKKSYQAYEIFLNRIELLLYYVDLIDEKSDFNFTEHLIFLKKLDLAIIESSWYMLYKEEYDEISKKANRLIKLFYKNSELKTIKEAAKALSDIRNRYSE